MSDTVFVEIRPAVRLPDTELREPTKRRIAFDALMGGLLNMKVDGKPLMQLPQLTELRRIYEAAEIITKEDPMARGLNYGEALKELRDGIAVTRSDWGNTKVWLKLQVPRGDSKMTLPYIYIRNYDGDLVPWCPTHSDLLATDWETCSGDLK